jgi:hypothetical protein
MVAPAVQKAHWKNQLNIVPGVPPGDFWWSLGTLKQIGWENLRSLTENLDARKTIESVFLHFL